MPRFYAEKENISDSQILITGEDVNHIKNVLRMKIGESLTVCDGEGFDYFCEVVDLDSRNQVGLKILEKKETETELPVRIVLYQGLPKKDKMELIAQKAVELGVSEIVPVSMKRSIVKIEDEKAENKKLSRWNEIMRAAAKQSGRGIVPMMHHSMSYKLAVDRAKSEGIIFVPYENAEGIISLKNAINRVIERKTETISIFIGPEGGFEDSEIQYALDNDANIVSLGKRILRTETAGLTTLSILMYELEMNAM